MEGYFILQPPAQFLACGQPIHFLPFFFSRIIKTRAAATIAATIKIKIKFFIN